jgi:uncharacterized membrane protein YhaH (DUF805 family)
VTVGGRSIRPGTLGTLEADTTADFVIVDGDPLTSIDDQMPANNYHPGLTNPAQTHTDRNTMEQFITAYKTALTRYVDFSGRTSVGGFWRFVAVNFVVAMLLAILGGISSIFFVLYLVYALAVILPSIAIAIRRLHDTGKSGWMILLGLIPFVGFIILIVFYIQPTVGPNEYGTGPED